MKLVFCSSIFLLGFHCKFEGNLVAALQSEYLLHCKYVQKTLAALQSVNLLHCKVSNYTVNLLHCKVSNYNNLLHQPLTPHLIQVELDRHNRADVRLGTSPAYK